MKLRPRKRQRISPKNRHMQSIMYSQNMLGVIISFLTTKEYLTTLQLTSIFYYKFLSQKENIQIVKRMLINEFSTKLVELYFINTIQIPQFQKSFTIIPRCIHFLYNIWMNHQEWFEKDKCLYWKILMGFNPSNIKYKENIMDNPSNQYYLSKCKCELFIDRMEQFPNNVETYIYWITQIMKYDDIESINSYTIPLHNVNTDQKVDIHISAITAYVLIQDWCKSKHEQRVQRMIISNCIKFVKWCKNNGYIVDTTKFYNWSIPLEFLFQTTNINMEIKWKYEWLCVIIISYCDDFEFLMNKLINIKNKKKKNILYKHLGEKKIEKSLKYPLLILYGDIFRELHGLYLSEHCNENVICDLIPVLEKYDISNRLANLNKFTKIDRDDITTNGMEEKFLNTISDMMQLN